MDYNKKFTACSKLYEKGSYVKTDQTSVLYFSTNVYIQLQNNESSSSSNNNNDSISTFPGLETKLTK